MSKKYHDPVLGNTETASFEEVKASLNNQAPISPVSRRRMEKYFIGDTPVYADIGDKIVYPYRAA